MFDAYIEAHGRRLYALCLKLCAGRRADAEDLYQETWLKAYRGFHGFRPENNFAAWVSKICVNTYRDGLRKKRLLPFLYFSGNDEQSPLEAVPAPEEDPAYAHVREAVIKLPDPLRLCVLLYYFHDCSVTQTAQALNLPAGTVKSRLHRARELLKEGLGDG